MAVDKAQTVKSYFNATTRDYSILLRLAHYWGMHFGYYDDSHRTLGEAMHNTNKVLAEMAHIKKGVKVLDAGCGVGGSAIWLAKNKGAYAIGVNVIGSHIKMAKQFAKKEGVFDMTEFFVRDMRDAKFPDHSFDVVWAVESACHLENKSDFIKEAYRLLKPGGCLIVADGFREKDNPSKKDRELLSKWNYGWAVPELETVKGFIGSMKSVGFTNIIKKEATKNVLPFSKFLYTWGIVGYPISKLMELFGIRSDVETGNVISAIWQYRTMKKGLWGYYLVHGKK